MASEAAAIAASDYVNFYQAKKGFVSWLWTTDHKRIALLYLSGITIFLLVAFAMGFLIRLELFSANDTAGGPLFADGDLYNRILTLHGVIMIFLFVIPGIPAVFGNFFLPILIGAEDVAFPRINLLSWYCYVVGAVLALLVVMLGGLDTGWTLYVPYSARSDTQNVAWALTAVFILGWSSILTGINFIVTIHRMRAPGMDWFKMPLFCWAVYSTSWIQVLATPVVGITLILVMLER